MQFLHSGRRVQPVDPARLFIDQLTPTHAIPSLREDVREGLLAPPRTLAPKYFYDDRGSRLFDAICDTPEYYPTRTEDALLRRHAQRIVDRAAPAHLVELGSGSARKTRHLLDACDRADLPITYWPQDVCAPMLWDTGCELIEEYPWLRVHALVGDYHGGLEGLPARDGSSLFVFLGGTIGNLEPAEAQGFLRALRGVMRSDDALLLGMDRVKEPAVLHAAYNDADGITAEFNLNLLRVLNRELDADFDPQGFHHYASYRAECSQIEMHLVADCDQTVTLAGINHALCLQQGESIRTEISRKFTLHSLGELVESAGFAVDAHYTPENEYFSLVLLRPIRA